MRWIALVACHASVLHVARISSLLYATWRGTMFHRETEERRSKRKTKNMKKKKKKRKKKKKKKKKKKRKKWPSRGKGSQSLM